MAEAINQNNIVDICKSFATSMKTVKDLKLDIIKQSMATFSNSAEYVIKFYKISSSITDTIVKSSAKLNTDSIKAQSAITDSIGKMIGTINTMMEMKLPNMISSEINFLRLRYQINQLMNIFVGNGGVISQLKVLSYVGGKHTIDRYDKDGNLIKTDTVEGVDFKKIFETFKEMVDSILEMIDSTEKIYKSAIKSEILRWTAMDALFGNPKQNRDGLFGIYIKLIQSPEFKQIGYKQTGEYIQKASDNISLFSELVKTITDIVSTKDFVSLLLYRKMILPEIVAIISGLSSVFKGNKENTLTFDDGIKEKLEQSLAYITSINSIITIVSELEKYKIHSKKINKIFSEIELILITISDFSQTLKSKKFAGIKPQITTIKSIIDSMLGLVGDIIQLGLALIPLTLATPLALGTLWVIGGFIKVAVHVINWISTKNDYSTIAEAVINITKIVGLMLLMVGMVLAELILIALSLPILIKSAELTLITFAVIAVITYSIAWLAVCINKVLERANTMWEGLLFMIGLIGVMLLVTGMLILFAALAVDFFTDNNWLMAIAMFGVIGVVTLAIAGLGYLISLMLPGIVAFATGIVLVTIAIGAMLLIGLELNLLAEFDFDEEKRNKIKTATASIIGAAKSVIDGLFYGFTEDDTPKQSSNGPFVSFFKSIFKGATFMIQALTASIVFVLTTISVTMMLLIGLELKSLANYQVDRDAVLGNVNAIMGTANSVIDAIFQPAEGKDTPGGSGFIGALKHFFTGLADIIELIAAVGKLAISMVAIALVRLLGSELNWIANFDTSNLGNATSNVSQIMSAADAVVNAIFNSGETQPENNGPGKKFLGFIKNTLKGIGDTVESIAGIGKVGVTLAAVGMVGFLAKTLQSINDVSIDKKTIEENTTAIITSANNIISQVFAKEKGRDATKIDEDKIEQFEDISKVLSKFIQAVDANPETIKENIDNTIKFVDKINTVKIENLEAATNMFAKMAEFSKSINGNFEGLADTINEKIIDALEKLNTTLEDTNTKIEDLKTASETISSAVVTGADGTTSVSSSSFNATDRENLSTIVTTLSSFTEKLNSAIDDIDGALKTKEVD